MKLALHRCWFTTRSTIGKLLLEEVFQNFILEDRYRPLPQPKVPHETCIPLGTYNLSLTFSPKFEVVMPLVWNVRTPDGRLLVQSPDKAQTFEGVRIHWGNDPADTDGCLLTGRARLTDRVLESRLAYEALLPKLLAADERKEPITLDVLLTPHEGEVP